MLGGFEDAIGAAPYSPSCSFRNQLGGFIRPVAATQLPSPGHGAGTGHILMVQGYSLGCKVRGNLFSPFKSHHDPKRRSPSQP